MSIWRIIFANLKHSRRQHFGTCLGLSIASMILVGSLTVGDSIHKTLWLKGKERIGLVSQLFLSEEGFFREDLADRIYQSKEFGIKPKVAPMVMTTGTIASPDGKIRASGISVLGIDKRFFQFAERPDLAPDLTEAGFWASPDLFNELKPEIGNRLVLRIEEPSLFSRDAPLSGERDARFLSWNQSFLGQINLKSLGGFSLRSNMEPSRTIFVPLEMLQEKMFAKFDQNQETTGFANLILFASTDFSANELQGLIQGCWTLADAGLDLKKLHAEDMWNLRSRRVFLSDLIVDRAREVDAGLQGELTYLVNAIRKPQNKNDDAPALIPYSMVTGVEPNVDGLLGADWKDNEIAVNQWAASDLNLSLGDSIALEYFVVDKKRELIEENRIFRVGKITPMPDKIPLGKESDWTPRFPGLSDAVNCGEWDTGIPIKHDIRPRDESYWDDYRGSPKAFISLASAQSMWGNRWGKFTGLRIKGSENAKTLGSRLMTKLTPANAGLRVVNLEKDLESSVTGPVNFGQLFLAFGFFVVLAGLSLSTMLFGFSLQQRNRQVGLLMSLGYSKMRIKLITWVEAGIICFAGSIMGVGWAWFFGQGVLWMLGGSWGGAVAKLNLHYAPDIKSVIVGTAASLLGGMIVLIWVCNRQINGQPVELLRAGENFDLSNVTDRPVPYLVRSNLIEPVIWVGVFALAFCSLFYPLPSGPMFFGIGALVLTGGLTRFYRKLNRASGRRTHKNNKLLRNLDKRSGRKAIVVGILSVGAFLVIGAGAFRQNQVKYSRDLKSGTGGFSHILKTSLPIYDDLLGIEASNLFDLNPKILGETLIVAVRSQDGDDASCLNLYQSKMPPLYGLPVSDMIDRFHFVEGNWENLKKSTPPTVIPAVVDQNTMTWSLKKRVGDRITYLDEEGEHFEVEIAAVTKGSFLQGGLFISEKDWIEKFSGRGGYNEFWIDTKEEGIAKIEHLAERLFNFGVTVQSTADRLTKLREVENTYLSIFQSLGGLGVLLGTVGLLVVVIKNLWERRREQAILGALGYSLNQLQKMCIRENRIIIFQGLCLGVFAGLLGIMPTARNNFLEISFLNVLFFSLGLFFLSYLCLIFAVHLGLSRMPFNSLRHE